MAEIGLWHAVRGSQPTRLLEESVPLEKDLESWIFEDPTLISPTLQRVRRQVPLGNKFIRNELIQRIMDISDQILDVDDDPDSSSVLQTWI